MRLAGISPTIFSVLISSLMIANALPPLSATPASSAPEASSRPWMNRSLSPEKRADLLLHAMTLDEKIAMVHGFERPTVTVSGAVKPVRAYVGYVPPNPRLGIPALRMADGRAGVGNGATGVTVLPAPIGAAASWDTDLLHRFGRVLGKEQWGKGTNVELGPSIDVVRVPEWGRTFESYGEDPFLNGQMAVAEIQGIQSEGPIADANMYLTMNQETNRLKMSSVVDHRTLHEIYLPPFEAAVQQGHVGTIMCAYVKTNATYSCENGYLLNDLLKKQLGFDGWVMSDWGATHSTVASAQNGLDQEMPDAKFYGAPLKAAVESGQVSEAILDQHVHRILATMFRFGLFDKQQTGTWGDKVTTPEHAVFSREVAEQGTVLLKNQNHILPLPDATSIAVIGMAGGKEPKISGGGSSRMVAPYVVSPLDGIRKRAASGTQVTYADGSNLNEAAATAHVAHVAIVFVHTNETEGEDRPNLKLPGHQDQLISAVAKANPNTIVVLDTGGPVLMPWIESVRGIIEAWYPGQEDGNAIAAILYGDVNPSGRLPLTFPRTEAEVPTSTQQQWPGVNGKSIYSEKLNVGYRWYDAHHVKPLFPFGFGLSYTTFKLADLAVTPKRIDWSAMKSVHAEVTVTNTGKRSGAEVVQIYVEQPKKNGEPPRQLRAFTKVKLEPGQAKRVQVTLDRRSFSIYDPSVHAWESPDGTYRIWAGTSSQDLPLHDDVHVVGTGSTNGFNLQPGSRTR